MGSPTPIDWPWEEQFLARDATLASSFHKLSVSRRIAGLSELGVPRPHAWATLGSLPRSARPISTGQVSFG